jgi:DnaJ-class molecular chaperone
MRRESASRLSRGDNEGTNSHLPAHVRSFASTDAIDGAQAYKVLALKKHPDKNRNNPKAAEEFQALRKAYEVLTDKDAKAALDVYLE